MDKEMMAALEADGEKLRQLTGEDHGPWDLPEPPLELVECTACDGEGHTVHRISVYEHGCGFPHDDSEERPCDKCGGLGWYLDDAKSNSGS